jgi:hypothetical protein
MFMNMNNLTQVYLSIDFPISKSNISHSTSIPEPTWAVICSVPSARLASPPPQP